MDEIWLPLKGYEGLYAISNFGRLYSYPRHHCKGGFIGHLNKETGYIMTKVSKNGYKFACGLHYLVYTTFIGSVPKGYYVNHIDENKENNSVWNLNLLTPKENSDFGTRNERIIETRNKNKSYTSEKAVLQYTIDMELVAEYKSTMEAERKTGFDNANIGRCCNGKQKQHKGYVWKWKEVA